MGDRDVLSQGDPDREPRRVNPWLTRGLVGVAVAVVGVLAVRSVLGQPSVDGTPRQPSSQEGASLPPPAGVSGPIQRPSARMPFSRVLVQTPSEPPSVRDLVWRHTYRLPGHGGEPMPRVAGVVGEGRWLVVRRGRGVWLVPTDLHGRSRLIGHAGDVVGVRDHRVWAIHGVRHPAVGVFDLRGRTVLRDQRVPLPVRRWRRWWPAGVVGRDDTVMVLEKEDFPEGTTDSLVGVWRPGGSLWLGDPGLAGEVDILAVGQGKVVVARSCTRQSSSCETITVLHINRGRVPWGEVFEPPEGWFLGPWGWSGGRGHVVTSVLRGVVLDDGAVVLPVTRVAPRGHGFYSALAILDPPHHRARFVPGSLGFHRKAGVLASGSAIVFTTMPSGGDGRAHVAYWRHGWGRRRAVQLSWAAPLHQEARLVAALP